MATAPPSLGDRHDARTLHVGEGLLVQMDRGCDWVRFDPRFGRCVTCPLPRCRGDYPPQEQQAAVRLLSRWTARP